jgi:hypothetical protein
MGERLAVRLVRDMRPGFVPMPHRTCKNWYKVTSTSIQSRDRPRTSRRTAHRSGDRHGWGTSSVEIGRRTQ